ncbi:MAG: hypothetical protein WKF84_15365 [Pyrinomonadaceae bacterium]
MPEENVIIGNVALYGATGGEAYIHGVAGERFAVRNSGAVASRRGRRRSRLRIHDRRGRVVVLGRTGRNFAAGMSGGSAYVLDDQVELKSRCNLEMVQLFHLEDLEEIELLQSLLARYVEHTGSRRASEVLDAWDAYEHLFVSVVPNDYRRVLDAQKQMIATGMSPDQAEMAAFDLNSHDAARAGGK